MDEATASVEQLRETLEVAALAGTIAAPVTHAQLLDSIVRTAAHVTSARAGTLFLIDEQRQELVFAVAMGPKAAEAKAFRVPLGQGIAGLVALTGQPMAISDAQQDTRHAADIAQAIGYLPRSILCLPLFHHDRVIGVLELLDKEGAPSFTPADMEALGLFAQQAAMAIELSHTQQHLVALIGKVVTSLGRQPEVSGFGPGAQDLGIPREAGDDEYQQALELAAIVHGIAAHGEHARTTCRAMLSSLAGCFPAPYQPAYSAAVPPA